MVAVNIVLKIQDIVFWSYVEFSEHENLKSDFKEFFFSFRNFSLNFIDLD